MRLEPTHQLSVSTFTSNNNNNQWSCLIIRLKRTFFFLLKSFVHLLQSFVVQIYPANNIHEASTINLISVPENTHYLLHGQ